MKMTKKGKALLLGTLTALLLGNMFTVFAYREDKLYLAAEDGDLENVKCYILQGADIDAADTDGNTPLVYAAKKGHIEIVRYLVNHSADVETYGGKALIYAAEYGHLGTVKYLVEYGVDVNARDNNGRTPLSYATSSGHTEIVEYLKEKGAEKKEERIA